MIGPYFERVLPAALMIMLASALLFRSARGQFDQYRGILPVLPLLALALAGVLRRWHWALRAVLHATWLGALLAYVLMRPPLH
jgi:hypothetical protein